MLNCPQYRGYFENMDEPIQPRPLGLQAADWLRDTADLLEVKAKQPTATALASPLRRVHGRDATGHAARSD